MRVISQILSKTPFFLLYLLSDFLYYILCYVIKYRKKVIIENLTKSFPEKTEKEIKQISKDFYKNLCDVALEVLKGYGLNKKEFTKRVQVHNPEVPLRYFKENKAILVMTSHLCNWEWLLLSCSFQLPYEVDAIYQKLNNPSAETFFLELRSKFGARLIEKNKSIKHLLSTANERKIIAMVSDQSPQKGNNKFQTIFLNQETVFFTGAEKIAKKIDIPVLYTEIRRVKRGFYKVEFSILTDQPKLTENDEITRQYVHALEKTINKNPSNWLWSHKRWKHSQN